MMKINIKPDCSLCRWEYITHDKGECVGCVNHSHFELCTERSDYRKLVEEKKREEEEEEQRLIMEAKERRKMEEKKRDESPEGKSGSDLIRRDQIVRLIRKMEKENAENTPATYYAACLQGGFESCLICMEDEVKKMDSADKKGGKTNAE